jgi:hypothetical protein
VQILPIKNNYSVLPRWCQCHKPSDAIVQQALKLLEEHKKIGLARHGKPCLPNSFTDGKRSVYGLFGEEGGDEFYRNLFGFSFPRTTGYDARHADRIMPEIRLVDLKTKSCTSTPKKNYAASVSDHLGTKVLPRCDWFLFMRAAADFSMLYICGYYPRDLYEKHARYALKGTQDPEGRGRGMKSYPVNCWNLPYGNIFAPPKKLSDFRLLVEQAEEMREYIKRQERQA